MLRCLEDGQSMGKLVDVVDAVHDVRWIYYSLEDSKRNASSV